MAAKAPKSTATKATTKAKATAPKEEAPAKKAPAKKAAAKPMTKTEIVNHFAEKFGFPKQKVREFFDEQARLAAAQAKVGFTIPGVGKLVVREYKAREGRNPRTGEKIKIKARKRLKFVISAAAKKRPVSSRRSSRREPHPPAGFESPACGVRPQAFRRGAHAPRIAVLRLGAVCSRWFPRRRVRVVQGQPTRCCYQSGFPCAPRLPVPSCRAATDATISCTVDCWPSCAGCCLDWRRLSGPDHASFRRPSCVFQPGRDSHRVPPSAWPRTPRDSSGWARRMGSTAMTVTPSGCFAPIRPNRPA